MPSREVFFLTQVSNQKYNKDFAVNLTQVNNTLKSLSKYLIVMQQGIDDLNRDIIEVIQDFINDIIIFLNGGDLGEMGIDFGDIKYIFQALGAFLGFNTSGSGTVIDMAVNMAKNFFENFFAPFNFFKNIIGNIIDSVLEILLGWLDWVPGVGTIREKLAGSINNATQTATAAQATAEGAQGTADSANTVAVYTTFNVRSNKPLWNSMDPTAEVSFPWVGLAFDTGGSVNTNNISATVARIAKMRMGNDQVMNTISFLARSSGTVTGFYFDIYKFQDLDSSWSLIYSSPNLSAQLTASVQKLQQVFSPDGYPVIAGEKYGIHFRMTGSGAVALAGKTFPDHYIPGFEPEVISGSRNPSSQAAPSLITNAQMDSMNDGNCPYVEMGSNIGQVDVPRSWYVNFDNSSWNDWVRFNSGSGNLGISNGKVRYNSSSDGWQSAGYSRQTASDKMEAQATFASMNDNRHSCIGICQDNSGLNGLRLDVAANEVYFRKFTSAFSYTNLASFDSGGAGTYKVRYSPSENKFYAYKLVGGVWTEYLSFIDSGNVIAHGTGHRFGMIGCSRNDLLNSGTIDEFYLRDW